MENGSHVKRETYKQAHNNRGGGGWGKKREIAKQLLQSSGALNPFRPST